MRALLTSSPHIRLHNETAQVVNLILPDGTLVPLTPTQAAHAVVTRHGNYGRSMVVVAVELEIEVEGDPEVVHRRIANALAGTVDQLRKEVSELKSAQRERDKA